MSMRKNMRMIMLNTGECPIKKLCASDTEFYYAYQVTLK